jgi:hypothetical protein
MDHWIETKDQMPPLGVPFWFLKIKPLHRIIGTEGQHIQITSWEELAIGHKVQNPSNRRQYIIIFDRVCSTPIRNHMTVYMDVEDGEDIDKLFDSIIGTPRWKPAIEEDE